MDDRAARYDYPGFHHPDFEATIRFLEENTGQGTRIHKFYRDYFVHSVQRIALNIICLKGILRGGDKYLDVGSFGIEPVVLKEWNPQVDCRALCYEGNVVGIDENGFYETTKLDVRKHVYLERTDVERDAFPFADDFFDVISCFEVIEHLKYSPIPMLKEIKRVLKPDGVFILTTPNINSAEAIVRILRGESPQECPVFHKDMNYGVVHPKEYTLGQLRDVFTEMGFEILIGRSIEILRPEGNGLRAVNVVKRMLPIFGRMLKFLGRRATALDLSPKLFFVVKKGSEIRSLYPATIFE